MSGYILSLFSVIFLSTVLLANVITSPHYEPQLECDLIIRQSGFKVEDVAVGFGGDSVSLTCDARCKGPGATPALEWYKEPSQIPIPSTRRRLSSYSRSSNRVQWLIITDFLQRNVGRYTCKGWLGPAIGLVEKSIWLQMGCAHPMISCDVSRCLPKEYRCDGLRQCMDGFDEYECGPDSCNKFQFYCDGRCFDIKIRCNGEYDCYDGLDEMNCEQERKTTPEWDTNFDYDDENTTETTMTTTIETATEPTTITTTPISGCETDLYQCLDGSCIPWDWVCDWIEECPQGDDEWDCWGSTSETVREDERTTAILPPTTTPKGCNPTYQFKCWRSTLEWSSFRTCIPRTWVCDGRPDCPHYEDEENCLTTTVSTESSPSSEGITSPTTSLSNTVETSTESGCESTNRFQCWNGRCIPSSWVCDGMGDCEEDEDELNCQTTTEPTERSTTTPSAAQSTTSDYTGQSTTSQSAASESTEKLKTTESTVHSTVESTEQSTASSQFTSDTTISLTPEKPTSQAASETTYIPSSSETTVYPTTEAPVTPSAQPETSLSPTSEESTARPTSPETTHATSTKTKPEKPTSQAASETTYIPSSSETTVYPTTEAPVTPSAQPETSLSPTSEEFTARPTSPETTHATSTKTKPVCAGQFSCGDGTCISLKQRCDSVPNCEDERDEANCGSISCSESQVACENGKQCVNDYQWGNGVCDCEDGSDEMTCE